MFGFFCKLPVGTLHLTKRPPTVDFKRAGMKGSDPLKKWKFLIE
jgi:hypothetical protein